MASVNKDFSFIDNDQKNAFWSKVDITNNTKKCWNWKGAKKPKGYGNVRINGKYLIAHRVAFSLANGNIPSGLMVCHICDNPSCCNPSHLMLGTAKSNAADMVLKDRQKEKIYAARGERNGNSKLTKSNVIEIRNLYANKLHNQYELAAIFNVTQTTIGAVVNRKIWGHV